MTRDANSGPPCECDLMCRHPARCPRTEYGPVTQNADYVCTPVFEDCPTAGEIAHWFVEEMRGVENVGGDAWWLSRNPHGACRMLAFVDYDVQEFWLLEITTNDISDLLWVMNGVDGMGFLWWQHPKPDQDVEEYWRRDGITWMADQIVLHYEYQCRRDASRNASSGAPNDR